MKKRITGVAISLFLVALVAGVIRLSTLESSTSAKNAPLHAVPMSALVACPGRVEGQTRTISVGAAIDGLVESVRVHEGDTVAKGQILAQIGCSDLRSALQVSKAEAEGLEHARARLIQGSRPAEREMAAQRTAAARSVLQQATESAERYQKLWDSQATSKASYEEARRDYEVASARLKEAIRNEELINAPPHSEDLARADADLKAAQDRIALADDRLGKCLVRAPISGSILRINLREGESFALLSPRPLFSMADISGRRVRAEVDERDIGRIRIGQQAFVTSDAYSARYNGTVREISSIMGRKSVATGDPADKSDRDVLEVLVELDNASVVLPLGLRVSVQFVR
jgi:HlyD family secretion protein